MANFTSIAEIPAQPPVGTEFGRGGNAKTLRMGNNMPVRQYLVNASGATHELPTAFTRVLGGWVFSPTAGGNVAAAQVIPFAGGNGSVAQVTGLTAENGLIVTVYGEI